MIPAAIISFILAGIIAVLMVSGLDYMKKNHPDYDGKDLFDEEQIGKVNKGYYIIVMSKLSTLKEQNPQFNIGLIDALSILFEKPKYVELAFNLHKHNFNKQMKNDWYSKRRYATDLIDAGFKKENIDKISDQTLVAIHNILDDVHDAVLEDVNKFIELNERGLIENKDVTSYKTLEELQGALSVAELKMMSKDLEKFVIKLYDENDWLVVKPLTYESSCKYGAGTKWCTASTSEEYQYHNYTRRGILIYAMNRKTGVKVAGFKNIDPDHLRETSFWNAVDERIDSSECNLPSYVLDVIITDFRSCIKSNYDLGTEETKKMNDERLNGKEKSNSLVYSLRELANRYDIMDNGEYTTTTTLTSTETEPQRSLDDQPVEEAVPSIEYELTNGGTII